MWASFFWAAWSYGRKRQQAVVKFTHDEILMVIADLENEYPGDAAWEEFVSAIRSLERPDHKSDVLSFAFCDEEMAFVLNVLVGEQASAWMTTPCSALEMRTPIAVSQSGLSGSRIIRSLLMRMP